MRFFEISYGLIYFFFVGFLLQPMIAYAGDTDIIINEIHYHPKTDFEPDEYIELYNRGLEDVDLSAWTFVDGIFYTFPNDILLKAGEYLLVARDIDKVQALAPGVQVFGNYTGVLNNSGERIRLFNRYGETIESIRYSDSPPWPTGPDGNGPSLERISPNAPGDHPGNWKSGDISRTNGLTPGRENTAYSQNLPPYISHVDIMPRSPKPMDPVTVQVMIEDADGVESVTLEYQVGRDNRMSPTLHTLEMKRDSGSAEIGYWSVVIPPQPDRSLVRFRMSASDRAGIVRIHPSQTEPRWTESYFVYENDEDATIPIVFTFDFGTSDRDDLFRGRSAFIFVPPGDGYVQVYDHISITQRKGGYNVYFLDQYELQDMSSINLVWEGKARYALAEWLSYHVYRSLGVPSSKVDHYRFIRNNRDLGYYLMFEQPNRHFIARNGIDNGGDLYKIIYGWNHTPTRSNIVSQHEKKTNLSTRHDSVVEMIQSFYDTSGKQETLFMETYFAVDEIMNYYVANQLLSDWDGYFNNHFVYYDFEGSGLWYIFPWDKDKTWGDSDAYRNILPYYNFYDMPILFGANGTPRSGKDNGTWWRPGGFIGGKFLSNADMQKRYLHRLGFVAFHEFTPERWIPEIDELERRLEPEVRHKAQVTSQNVNSALTEFHNDIESFRRQVINRREFIINEVEKLIGPVLIEDWLLH